MANQDVAPEGTETSGGPLTTRVRRARPSRFRCVLCGKEKPARDIVRLDVVRPNLLDRIRDAYPELPAEGFVCIDDLDRFRSSYVSELLRSERGELAEIQQIQLEIMQDTATRKR
jgi:hypothetical protein